MKIDGNVPSPDTFPADLIQVFCISPTSKFLRRRCTGQSTMYCGYLLLMILKIINGLQKDKYKLNSSEAAVRICHVYGAQRLFKINLMWFLLFAPEHGNFLPVCPTVTTAKAANSAWLSHLFWNKEAGGHSLAGTLRCYWKCGWSSDEQRPGNQYQPHIPNQPCSITWDLPPWNGDLPHLQSE